MLKKWILAAAVTASLVATTAQAITIDYPGDYFHCLAVTNLVVKHKPLSPAGIKKWLRNGRCGSDHVNGLEIRKAIHGNLLPTKGDTVTFFADNMENSITITKTGFGCYQTSTLGHGLAVDDIGIGPFRTFIIASTKP